MSMPVRIEPDPRLNIALLLGRLNFGHKWVEHVLITLIYLSISLLIPLPLFKRPKKIKKHLSVARFNWHIKKTKQLAFLALTKSSLSASWNLSTPPWMPSLRNQK
jgi:hypothetical protein